MEKKKTNGVWIIIIGLFVTVLMLVSYICLLMTSDKFKCVYNKEKPTAKKIITYDDELKMLKYSFDKKSDEEFKEISREEAMNLLSMDLPGDFEGTGCGYTIKYYSYEEYVISIKVGGCFQDTTIDFYANNHLVETIDNAYARVYYEEEVVETYPIVTNGVMYYMSALDPRIDKPVFLNSVDMKKGLSFRFEGEYPFYHPGE